MTRDTLAPGVAALARALVAAFHEFDGNRPGRILLPEGMAERALAALSPADRLAIAGITEERLAEVMDKWFTDTGIGQWAHPEDGDIALLLALLATPVTPEGGEQ